MKDQDLKLMEQDKLISSLKWKLKDSETSITILNANINCLAAEVDIMSSGLKPREFFKIFEQNKSESSPTETGSLQSGEDEAMSSSDKASQIHSHLSYAESEDGSSVFNAAKSPSNGIVELTSDLQIRKTEDDTITITSPLTTAQLDRSPWIDKNDNNVHDRTNIKVTQSASEQDRSTSNGLSKESLSWEKFDLSGNFKGGNPENEAVSDAPLRKLLQNGLDKNDPWISPLPSPLVKQRSSLSKNCFWENEDKNGESKYFFVPDIDKKNEVVIADKTVEVKNETLGFSEDFPELLTEVDREKLNKNNQNLTLNSSIRHGNQEESPEDSDTNSWKLDVRSRNSDMDSWNSETSETIFENGLPEKGSIHNLWDFEPDSIVDVSTGKN